MPIGPPMNAPGKRGAYPQAKPWLSKRRGESREEWRHRLYRTCYRCGHYEEDPEVLEQHEQGHSSRHDG